MKRIILAILAISAICFAQSSEKCNPNPDTAPNASTVNYDPNLPEGTCYNVGYVCQLSVESSGGVRFILGKKQDCSELESTHFVANHVNNDGSSSPLSYLQPYLQEGPVDNVSGLVVAMNTAFLISASAKTGAFFTRNSLANQQVPVSTRYLKIILDSDDDDSQGWGYSITNVEHVPYGVLQVLFPPYKKGE